MRKFAYYNEIDPKAAAWIRELIKAGLVTDGEVDERSIEDVLPSDLARFARCHFFSGIAVWDYALNSAGYDRWDKVTWTGSCPCQPFSAAGKRGGTDDARHLWPAWYRLIQECRPDVIFGEQVSGSSIIGRVADQNTSVQEVLNRAAVFRVLRELQRQSKMDLQDMRDRGRANTEAHQSGQNECSTQSMATSQAGPRSSQCGEASGEGARTAVQFSGSGYSGKDRCGCLRNDWDSFRSFNTESMELPLAGSDCSRGGIYNGQCESGTICPECNGEYLGASEDCGDIAGDFTSEIASLERLIASFSREIEGNNRPTWFDIVRSDLDRAGYSVGACSTNAAGFGAPHIRQRLYFVADAECAERWPNGERRLNDADWSDSGWQEATSGFGICGETSFMAAAAARRLPLRAGAESGRWQSRTATNGLGETRILGNAISAGSQGYGRPVNVDDSERREGARRHAATAGFWSNAEWVYCRDGKYRAVESVHEQMADGIAGDLGLVRLQSYPDRENAERTIYAPLISKGKKRVMRLRGYGNAIVAPVAEAFIRAYMEVSA